MFVFFYRIRTGRRAVSIRISSVILRYFFEKYLFGEKFPAGGLFCDCVRFPDKPVAFVAVRAGVFVEMDREEDITDVFFHAGPVFMFMGASDS